jgi:hypothetical protein
VEQLVQAVRMYVDCALAMGNVGRHAV